MVVAVGVLLTFDGTPGGLWFAVIGVFLVVAANAGRLQEQVVATFTGVRAEELMSAPVVSIPSRLTLEQARQQFARYRYTAFPVVDDTGRAVGMLSIAQLERTSPSDRARLLTEASRPSQVALEPVAREP